MGLTHLELLVANPARPRRSVRLQFFVDSGAVYSVVPADVLRRLGIRPHSRRTFFLADGSKLERKLGDAIFRLDGSQGASPVIFGERGDSVFLGAVSLGALGRDPRPAEARAATAADAARARASAQSAQRARASDLIPARPKRA